MDRRRRADGGVHRKLGCGSVHEYLERVLGYGPRVARDRLRVARALAELPKMTAALASGELCHSAVRELTRVATPDTESAWIESARGKVLRDIEEAVSGHERGDRPDDPADAEPRPMTIELEVSASTLALYREALRRLEVEVGEPLTDDQALGLMCRTVLAADGCDESERVRRDNASPYQIAITTCTDCRRAWQDAAGRSFAIDAHAVDQACCDAQVIGHVDGDAPARATRTIPPAIRRQVMRRDRGRCIVPGCRAGRFLEVHHVVRRIEGGTHDPRRLGILCSSHHHAVHAGLITITGESPAFVIRRVVEQRSVQPAQVDAEGPPRCTDAIWGDAISALCNTGFARGEAARAVRDVVAHVGTSPAPTTLESIVRAALRALRPRS